MKSLFLSSLLALGLLAVPAQAAEYPAKPITLMTAFNAGGGSDVSHRLLEKFAKGVFDQPIVVTYKAGAGGEIGWTWLVGAKADGYNIGGVDLPHIVLQPMLRPEGQPGYKTEQLNPLCCLVFDPDILIVIFSGFGEFEYAKKAIRYNVSEYMLKPVTAMELARVIESMKEKVDARKKEQQKMESLAQTSQDYHKNADVIRSKALETLVNCTRDVQVSLTELKKLGICFDCPSYRVAVFDMDTYSELYQVDMHKQQESALMSFVLFNVSNEIVTRENAGVSYQE